MRTEDGAIRPSCFDCTGVPDDDKCHKWADTIRYADEARQDTSQLEWRNFADVAYHHGRHDTDRKAIDELASKEDRVRSRDELDGNRDERND